MHAALRVDLRKVRVEHLARDVAGGGGDEQFFVADGDKVPMTFSRNATAHTVSARQFNRRNAVQGIMVACSLLYRLDEEARALEVAKDGQ